MQLCRMLKSSMKSETYIIEKFKKEIIHLEQHVNYTILLEVIWADKMVLIFKD